MTYNIQKCLLKFGDGLVRYGASWCKYDYSGSGMPNSGRSPPKEERIMPVSKSQQKAVHKYVKANYDRMELTVPKGRKDIIKAHAEAHSESTNGFINRAISETMERDNSTE